MLTKNAVFALTIAASTLNALNALNAQEIGGAVVQDPDAGTVTYTIDVDGPPRGSYYLFVAPCLAPRPLQIPGIGALYLDPLYMLNLGQFALDGTGHGGMDLTVPMGATSGRTMIFQAVVVDPLALRLTRNFLVTQQDGTPGGFAPGSGFAGDFNSRTNTYNFIARGMGRGAHIEVLVNGVPLCMTIAGPDGTGRGSFQIPAGLGRTDVVQVRVDGRIVATFRD